ncbi:hypothetical protein BH18ACT9_BH18ACT9_01060 [soil metagenome]
MSSSGAPLLAASTAVALASGLSSWLVTAATLPYGIPTGTVAFLGVAVMVLTSGLGLVYVGRRWPAATLGEQVAGLFGPLGLATVILLLSVAPLGLRVVTVVALAVSGWLGLRAGSWESLPTGRPLRSETGSGSLELLGVVILAAVLTTASVGAVASSSPAVKETIWAQICKITGGDCPAGESPSNTAYKPEICELYSSKNKVSANVDVAFIRLAGGGTVQRVEKSNGEIEITLLSEGRGGAVVAAGGHGNVRLGEHSVGVDFEAEAAATVGIQSGETYVFTNKDEADAFQGYLQGELAQDATGAVNPVYGALNWAAESVTGEESPTNSGVQKTYTRFDVTAEAKAEASAGFGSGVSGEVSYLQAIGSEFNRGRDPDDPADDQNTTFIQVDWTAAANAGLPVVKGIDASHDATGIIKLTTDSKGVPVRVQFIDRSQGTFQFGLQANQGSTSPADGSSPARTWGLDFKGGPRSSTVVSQTLALDSPTRRQAFADWVNAAGGANIASSVVATTLPGKDSASGENLTAFGDGAQGFADLMAQQSQVSIVEYDGTTWGLGLGGGISLGLKASADFDYEDTDSSSTKAAYLGAPDAEGNRTAYELPECVA